MSKDLIWVAMTNKKGWASSRTRDNVDVAFTLLRPEVQDENYCVEVRIPIRQSDPTSRARIVVGKFYFTSDAAAKLWVNAALEIVNKVPYPDINKARRDLLSTLMMFSEDTQYNQNHQYWGTSVNKESYYSDTDTQKYVYAHDVTKQPANPSATPHATMPDTGGFVPYNPVVQEHVGMVEAIEEIQAVVEPVFDPTKWKFGESYPAGYMVINKKLVKIEWPK